MPRCGTRGWVISIHRAWIFYTSETELVSRSRGLSRTATFGPWGKLNSLLVPREPTTKSTGIFSCATGPDGPLRASGHRWLQVRQQDNRRVHQVDRRLAVCQQESSSSVALPVHRLDGHSLRMSHRSLARRQGRCVHRGGVLAVLLGDRYYPRVLRHQDAAANSCVQSREENSVRHGLVLVCRQRLSIVHVKGAVYGGCVSEEQDSA